MNEDFINHANIDLQLNGLIDLTLLQTTKEEIADLSGVIQDNLGLKFNFSVKKIIMMILMKAICTR